MSHLDNDKELAQLLRVFGHMPIDAILPMHVREYMDIRGQVAKVRANREKALFSHIFNKAREWGYTASQNPCQGVKGFREAGRDRYVTDEELAKVKEHAHYTVADAMDLALLTGQRPADVLKLRRTDIRDGALWIVQNKTGARIGVEASLRQFSTASQPALVWLLARFSSKTMMPTSDGRGTSIALRQSTEGRRCEFPVQGFAGQGRYRHGRSSALSEAPGA